jgi:hypothetical protein
VTHEPGGISNAYIGRFWSAHDRWLVYGRSSGRTLRTIVERPDGSGTHTLVRWRVPLSSFDLYQDAWSSLDWAPNDDFAVYYDRAAACGPVRYAIYRVDAATGVSRQLTNRCVPRRA